MNHGSTQKNTHVTLITIFISMLPVGFFWGNSYILDYFPLNKSLHSRVAFIVRRKPTELSHTGAPPGLCFLLAPHVPIHIHPSSGLKLNLFRTSLRASKHQLL